MAVLDPILHLENSRPNLLPIGCCGVTSPVCPLNRNLLVILIKQLLWKLSLHLFCHPITCINILLFFNPPSLEWTNIICTYGHSVENDILDQRASGEIFINIYQLFLEQAIHGVSSLLHFFTRIDQFLLSSCIAFTTQHVSLRLAWVLQHIPEVSPIPVLIFSVL